MRIFKTFSYSSMILGEESKNDDRKLYGCGLWFYILWKAKYPKKVGCQLKRKISLPHKYDIFTLPWTFSSLSIDLIFLLLVILLYYFCSYRQSYAQSSFFYYQSKMAQSLKFYYNFHSPLSRSLLILLERNKVACEKISVALQKGELRVV